MSTKPSKPRPDFPLFAHANGQWCRKIRSRFHYFGPWADPEAALNLYLDQRDDLQAGRKPRKVSDTGPTVADGLNHFLSAKKLAEQAGEIRHRSYLDYETTCDRIAASLGKDRPLCDVDVADLQKLRADLSKGERGERGPTTVKNDLTRARMVFLYFNEYLVEKPIKYRKVLKSPAKRQLREAANLRGPRMFQPKEIRALLKVAPPQLRAMIYLGINCGFGNADCGTLPIDQLDLAKGWHTYWRPKTHNPRRCPLWPETVKALKQAIEKRPKPASEELVGLVFLTREGACWSKEAGDNAISSEFRKLLRDLGIYRPHVTFYTLRRTFETIAAVTGEQVAIDHIMGHIAPTNDMAAVYRQQVFDKPLLTVTNHVRAWLHGRKKVS